MAPAPGALVDTKAWDIVVRVVSAGCLGYLDSQALAAVVTMTSLLDPGDLDPTKAAALLSHVCVFVFLLIQSALILLRPRPLAKAACLQPRISALLGTWLMMGVVLLPVRNDLSSGLYLLSAALGILGDLLAIYVVLHLGRSFSFMAEARGVVAHGPYAIVRHPLYLAEETALASAVITHLSLAAAVLFLTQICFQVQRARNEERVLAEAFRDYAAYRERTPGLVPGFGWIRRYARRSLNREA